MEKTSINEQGGDVNHMTGIPLFTVRLFKRRIRDCPNIEIGKIIINSEMNGFVRFCYKLLF